MTMKALTCATFGPPSGLVIQDWPIPRPGPGEVRIAIHAAGVNFPDALIVQDKYHVKATPPFIPGAEVAGVIDAVGEGVEDWHTGDRVIAMTTTGGFAQHVVVAADRVVALPRGIGFDAGAALLMTHGTAMHALAQRAQAQAGERMLVLGAGGGVGLAAVALGAAMGMHVIAAASSEEKLTLARQHGAHEVLNYNAGDMGAALKARRPVDIIVDPIGGALAEKAFRAMAPGGRRLVVGFASGQIPALPFNLPLLKSAAIVGVFWGAFATARPDQHRANMARIFAMIEAGALDMPITRRVDMAHCAQAIADLGARGVAGKIVMVNADG